MLEVDYLFKIVEVSKYVQFHRRNQRVPTVEQVYEAHEKALNGDISGAIELLNWRRHCFYAKTQEDTEVMEMIFNLSSGVME